MAVGAQSPGAAGPDQLWPRRRAVPQLRRRRAEIWPGPDVGGTLAQADRLDTGGMVGVRRCRHSQVAEERRRRLDGQARAVRAHLSHLSGLALRRDTGIRRLLSGNTEISDKWWGGRHDIFPEPGYRRTVAFLVEYLCFRLLPACLSEMQLAQGKYADAVRQLIGPAGFDIFAAAGEFDPFTGFTVPGILRYTTDGPLPYASLSDRSTVPPKVPPSRIPTNRAELGYFKLKLGNATLEWADVLYRSNAPEAIMRARELYKAVLFLHGEDPEITPSWARREAMLPIFPYKKSKRNPAIVGQVNRARLGFLQINTGLNYYGLSPSFVPPV